MFSGGTSANFGRMPHGARKPLQFIRAQLHAILLLVKTLSCLIVLSGKAAGCSSQGIPASRGAGYHYGSMPSEPM